jgi:predicted CxxxxCH...CXXCH cytochrome family protein
VTFTALTGVNSYDEDDGAAGGAGEANSDDLCATCHTVAGGTNHNNRDNSAVDHNQGVDCFSCHKAHTDATAPFGAGAGNACNSCHGNPPATAAHARHATVATHDLTEDRTDCAFCHTGADSYTFDPSADQGASLNHSNAAGRKTILGTAVGYAVADGTCTNACHASSVADGTWSDANGLNCNACHYAAAEPSASGANNTAAGARKLSEQSHNAHFDKDKTCSACHDVSYSPTITSIAGPLTHINDFTTAGAADDGAAYVDKGAATQDEATVVRTGMTFDDGLNTCSGGIGLGCHATGVPDWDVAIPASGCTQCHTNTSDATVNPTSGLHGVTPSVSGQRHDDSVSGGCAACHTTVSAQATHMDSTFQGGNGQKTQMGLPAWYTQTADNAGTCASTSCHLSTSDSWAHVWTNTANYYTNATTACGGCHGLWSNWASGVINHRTGSEAETVHGTGATYRCKDCHGIESASGYPFTFGSNDWKNVEAGTTLHGDGQININTAGTTGYTRGTYGGCTGCHVNNDGTAAGQHAFTITSWTLATITSDAISTSCFSCHGGATVGVSKSNYWPDGANTQGDNTTPDNSGEHAAHIAKLALKVYGETISGAADNDILKDNTTLNPALTSDAKQKELCSYCHTTPGADGDHGVTYPADVNTMYTLWSKALDNGVYTAASGTCATVDCHNNKSTTTAYDWYDGAASTCVMCHLDVTAETAHTAHTAAGMGMTIGCDRCHQAATNWGTNTPPASGHIDGTFSVSGGSITFTYSGFTYPSVKGTCGTNNCHNNGKNGAPRTSSYTWGTPIAGCDACHGDTTASLTTQSHAVHTGSTIQSIACGSCHAAATAATHIDTNVTFGGSVSFTYTGDVAITGSTYGGCGTNNCHNNGKNGAPRTAAYTWGTTIATTCGECHGDTAATLTTQAHAAHLNASGTYGRTIVCTDCHTAETNLTNHVNATINFTGLTYTGDVAITGTTYGSCGTNACHQNGLGGAPVTGTYNWDTTLAGCSFCHNSAAMTSGAHTTHVGTANAWGPYPATGSTNCGECHQANANNTSMASQATHLNGSVEFTSSTTLAATTACNACHGGATPAGTAKTNWPTATRVACESCHGDYTAAVIGGKTAPSNAGTSFDSYGHGKVAPSAYGGPLCADCHNNTAAGHLDGTTGDDKRLKVVNTQDYGVSANGFCASACHATVMNVHFDNTKTGGGASDNGDFCYICHNPHGQNGSQDAMIRSTIAGRAVSGFADKASRGSYSTAGFNGVCQVCHDGAEVAHFNRATNETTHNSPTLCTDCHSHTAATAFSPSGGGCDGCHGYPPVQQLSGAGAPYTYAKVEDYPGGGRAHAVAAHLNPTGLDPADGWAPCSPCHTEADHNMGLGVGNLQTERDNSANWGNEAARYPRVNLDAAFDKGGTAFFNMGARNTTAGMGYCSNASCHFGESPKWDCIPADTTNDPN